MTSKKSFRKSETSQPVDAAKTVKQADMVKASESAWSGMSVLGQSKSAGLSRGRMLDARGDMLRAEREFIALSSEVEANMNDQAEELQREAAMIRSEAWAIEQEATTRITVLRAQARMEAQLAKHIKDIAERSALSVLDRIKEASDSLMDYAGLIGNDLADMLKKEASEQIERKVTEIKALEEAMDEEGRTAELLELTARYQKDLAA